MIKINKYKFNNKNHHNISFGAGKINLYSDFDGTYCPISHENLKNISPNERTNLIDYCENFKNFFSNTKNELKFHITTGRTFGEYEAVSQLIRRKGAEMPLPDTFIAKNGSDEYIKCGTDENFYKNGIFPFRYDLVNLEKENAIKKQTGWDGPALKAKLKEIFKEHNLRIVEADSENSVEDYGNNSFFSYGKIPDERKRKFYSTNKPEWVVGLRNDGNCKIYITYPPDMETNPERIQVLNDIHEEMKSSFQTTPHNYMNKRANECCERPFEVIEPFKDSKLSLQYQRPELQGLTKQYDTKIAVKKAIKNNDLVIAAGNGSNDLPMLNPLSYIDLPKDCKTIQDLDPIKHKKFIKKFNKLPFVGIIINKPKKSKEINLLIEQFGFNNTSEGMLKENLSETLLNPKIIVVENGHLEDGVKKAIELYAQENPNYAKKLSPYLKKEILGIDKNLSKKCEKKISMKYLGFIALALGILGTVFAFIKKSKQKTQKLQNNMNNILINSKISKELLKSSNFECFIKK